MSFFSLVEEYPLCKQWTRLPAGAVVVQVHEAAGVALDLPDVEEASGKARGEADVGTAASPRPAGRGRSRTTRVAAAGGHVPPRARRRHRVRRPRTRRCVQVRRLPATCRQENIEYITHALLLVGGGGKSDGLTFHPQNNKIRKFAGLQEETSVTFRKPRIDFGKYGLTPERGTFVIFPGTRVFKCAAVVDQINVESVLPERDNNTLHRVLMCSKKKFGHEKESCQRDGCRNWNKKKQRRFFLGDVATAK